MLYKFFDYKNNKNIKVSKCYLLSLFPIFLLNLTKSIGLFLIGIPGYFLFVEFLDSIKIFFSEKYFEKKKKMLKISFSILLTGIIGVFIALIPLSLHLFNGYKEFCKCLNGGSDCNKLSFCKDRIPNIYNFVEKYGWNVGWLKQFNKFNKYAMIFGMEMLFINYNSIYDFSVKIKLNEGNFKKNDIIPFLLFTIITTIIYNCYGYLMSLMRFFCSNPMMYWHISNKILDGSYRGKIYLFIFVEFAIVGILSFPNGYTWI